MFFLSIPGRRSLIVLIFIFVLLAIKPVTGVLNAEPGGLNEVEPKWTKSLPARLCYGSSSDTNCHRSSPALVDLTGDHYLEIVVATNNGHVVAVRRDGATLWDVDIAPYFGMSAGTQQINSSPAVADVDADGKMEVVVGAGTDSAAYCTQGGVIILEDNGAVKPGWPVLTQHWDIPPSGCRETVFTTPALGDMDMDGDMEIVFAAWDKRIYALHHNGQFVNGYPPDSVHYSRFGWDVLKGRLADHMWGSPALSDLSGDGFLDVIISTGEGNYDYHWEPVVGNWYCPYRPVNTLGYCGGSVYALDRNGNHIDGFPRFILEAIDSTPAITDINNDGRPEIFVGTGSWYYNNSPDHPTEGFRLFGFDNQGNDLPGWEGGNPVGGFVASSPSIGDITGDGEANIVVAASDRKLYAFNRDGSRVAGFPMIPTTHFSQVLDGYDVGTNFILADYTGDGIMEIFLRHASEIIIVSGTGQQLTAPAPDDYRPAYYTGARIWNNPAVGDLDGDGHLELVAQNSNLTVWDLPDSSPSADWPMFKRDAVRSSAAISMVTVEPKEYYLFVEEGETGTKEFTITLYGRLGSFDWTISSDHPDIVTFPKSSGTIQGVEHIPVKVLIPAGLPVGDYSLGNIFVDVSSSSGSTITETIPLDLKVVKEISRSHLPFVKQ